MSIKLNGSSAGSVSFDAPADTSPTGTDVTLTLPTSAGSANQFLKNSGTAGTLEYSSMVEDSSGRLLVGTTTPTVSKLFVAGGSLSVSGADTDFASGGNRALVDFAGGKARIGAVDGGGSPTALDFVVGGGRVGGLNTSGILDAYATESKATNGYVKLPSGIYIQWGVNASTTGGSTHNFPIAFPTAAWVVVGSHNNQANPASSQCTVLSASQFSLTTSAGSPQVNWIAIGY